MRRRGRSCPKPGASDGCGRASGCGCPAPDVDAAGDPTCTGRGRAPALAGAAGEAALTLRLVVEPRHAGLRLDQLLAAAGGLSRRRARALIAGGAVRRNGEATRVQGREVAAWDVVDVALPPAVSAEPGSASAALATGNAAETGAALPAPLPPASPPPPLPVLFHDGWLLALDKPPGVLSQPAERRVAGELAMDERAALRLAWEQGSPPFLRLVHRLDRGTSGVLLFARSAPALPRLAAAWGRGAVERRYVALVEGVPAASPQRVTAPIARAPGGGWRFVVADHGRSAATDVEVVQAGAGHALVCCRLTTGRTHQVRVHLAHLGHPVVGDRLYGSLTEAARPLLHAAAVRLPHPDDGRELLLEAPVPPDLAAARESLVAVEHGDGSGGR